MSWPGRLSATVVLSVALAPSLTLAAGKCERVVATGSPDAPPYLWRDPADPRHLIGASADLLAQVAAELGLTVEVLYAGKRSQAQEEVRSGRMDLLVDAPMVLADLDTMDFIHPPLVLNDYQVWTQQGSALVYNTVGDLHGRRGAVSARARLTASFESFAQQNLSLAHTENLTQAFQQLMLGQVEYVVAGRYAGLAMAQTLGLSKDLVAHEVPLDRPGLYLALSHNSACNDPWLRGQLAKKMTELPASAQAQGVVQRNVERWKAQMQQPLNAPKQ